jgi:hypothetical protein
MMTVTRRFPLAALIASACLMFAGCGGEPADEPAAPDNGQPTSNVQETHREELPDRPADDGAGEATDSTAQFKPLSGKVKFKTGNDETAFSFKPADDGAKLVDGDEKELARFNVAPARLKVKNPDDSEAGNIRITMDRLKVDDPQGGKMFELQRQPDGDWKLDDKDENLVYKIKRRDYGYELEAPDETSLFKIKLKKGKLSIRDSQDNTVYSTKDSFPQLSAAVIMMEEIKSQPLRAGLAVAIALQIDGLAP